MPMAVIGSRAKNISSIELGTDGRASSRRYGWNGT